MLPHQVTVGETVLVVEVKDDLPRFGAILYSGRAQRSAATDGVERTERLLHLPSSLAPRAWVLPCVTRSVSFGGMQCGCVRALKLCPQTVPSNCECPNCAACVKGLTRLPAINVQPT